MEASSVTDGAVDVGGVAVVDDEDPEEAVV